VQFDVTVLEDVRKLQRMLTPSRFWSALERILPRALTPVLVEMKSVAPRGKTQKLARGFDLRLKRIEQGLIHGLQVDVGARKPTGHLVHEGHRIIARGRSRGTLGPQIGTKIVTRNRLRGGFVISEPKTLAVRSTRSAELKKRRAAGPIGRVPGNPFAFRVMAQRQAQTIGFIEKLLVRELVP
jgi:hypothetical protein